MNELKETLEQFFGKDFKIEIQTSPFNEAIFIQRSDGRKLKIGVSVKQYDHHSFEGRLHVSTGEDLKCFGKDDANRIVHVTKIVN